MYCSLQSTSGKGNLLGSNQCLTSSSKYHVSAPIITSKLEYIATILAYRHFSTTVIKLAIQIPLTNTYLTCVSSNVKISNATIFLLWNDSLHNSCLHHYHCRDLMLPKNLLPHITIRSNFITNWIPIQYKATYEWAQQKAFLSSVLLTLKFQEVYLCTGAKQLYKIKTQLMPKHTIFWYQHTKRLHHWYTQEKQLPIS